MGKDLKGRELGRNISQEKTGFYCGRFTDKNGKRKVKRFKKLQECRQWLAEAMYADEHSDIRNPMEMTVDAWYEQWIEMRSLELRQTTLTGYQMYYKKHVKPVIGNMLLKDVRSMHCQKILSNAATMGLAKNTIMNIKRSMHNMFELAVDNEIILSNPCKKSVNSKIGKEAKKRRSLTLDEQERFIECAFRVSHYNDFCFVLQTGLRVGELSGLMWDDVDFEKKRITVRRTISVRQGEWYIRNPKSEKGTRSIPLTKEAIQILESQKIKNSRNKIIPLEWKNHIFLDRKGEPVNDANYNKSIKRVCKACNVEKFTMHELRHTFATRCIEAGMKPKILQQILGHSKLSMTMDLYVHVTDDEKAKEMEQVEHHLSMAQ